jgi:hypothetical protein
MLLFMTGGASATTLNFNCVGQEAPGNVSFALDETAATASFTDNDGLGGAVGLPAVFNISEVRIPYRHMKEFSIDWVMDRTDLTAAEIFTEGPDIRISTFLCEEVPFPATKAPH